MIRHRDPIREDGQAIILVVLSMTIFFTVALLVLDGSRLFVERRAAQTAADAAALAASWDLASAASTYGQTAHDYAANNGFPNVDPGNPSGNGSCIGQNTTNCYKLFNLANDPNKIEVRVTEHVSTLFGAVVSALSFGNFSGFDVSARAVADATDQAHCVFNPPVSNPDQYLNTTPPCTIPAQPSQTGTYQAATPAHCTFNPPVTNPDQYVNTTPPCTGPVIGGLNGSVALVMTRDCNAISYSGAGGGTIGVLATNGGLNFSGNAPKRVNSLGSARGTTSDNHPGCPNAPLSPPSGTGQCVPSATTINCATTLVDLSSSIPLNWSVTPPTPTPTPMTYGTWTPKNDFPLRCNNIGGTKDVTFTPASTYSTGNGSASGPPGLYCFTVDGKTLQLTGNFKTQVDGSGNADGYTFFAVGVGSQIAVNGGGSGTKVKFYWPTPPAGTTCDPRPTSRDMNNDGVNDPTFTCFGRTIATGYNSASCSSVCYDPQTLLYSTNATGGTGASCASSAICISGSEADLDGDLFAPNGPSLPSPYPASTTAGGKVYVAGGSASTGSGFIESWWLAIEGNTGSYTGTGMNVGGAPELGTYTPPGTAHCVFNPPVSNPDQYINTTPPCTTPGTPTQHGTYIQSPTGNGLTE